MGAVSTREVEQAKDRLEKLKGGEQIDGLLRKPARKAVGQ
jgi:hypothetical protein